MEDSPAARRLEGGNRKNPRCPISTVPRFSGAKLLARRADILQHPDHGVVPGAFLARPPRGFDRQPAAVLYRLPTGSAFTLAWISRFTPHFDSDCHTCQVPADAQHLLLHCPIMKSRPRVFPAQATQHLPAKTHSFGESREVTETALKKVATYLGDTELLDVF